MMILGCCSSVRPFPVRSPLWLAMAVITGVSSFASAAEPERTKTVPANAAPISTDTSKELLRYLINSQSLTLVDAEKLVTQLRAEQSKKTSEDLLKNLMNSKALSLNDAQKLVDALKANQTQAEKISKTETTKPVLVPAPTIVAIPAPSVPVAVKPVTEPVITAAPVAPVPNVVAMPTSVAATSTSIAIPSAPVVAATEKKPEATVAEAPKPVEPAGRVRAVYLPDSERQRIRDELKVEILAAAKKEGWIQVEAAPEWTRKIRLSGDFMMREQSELYDDRNPYNTFNYQAINSGSPVNTTIAQGTAASQLTYPFLNTTQNRSVTRLRARLNLQATVADNLEAGLRLATGNTSNPVSSNQTLSSDFSKVNFLLDRAWLRYQASNNLTIAAGRIASPWVAATDLVWDKDVNFDGWSGQYKLNFGENVSTFATAGLFSLESTEANFPSNTLFKVGSHDKWLYGIQLGGEWRNVNGWSARSSLAYFDFANVQGELSSPCYTPSTAIACDTDHTRPAFVQKGNTMVALRDVLLQTAGVDPAYQYFGLASPYRVMELNATLDKALTSELHAQVDMDIVKNLAFSKTSIISRIPTNNLSPCPTTTPNCKQTFIGGDTGYQLQMRVGYPQIREYGQWNTVLGYRYVESDAVMDAFTDSDFHTGGTNSKGYYLGGSFGFTHNAWLTARWLSATEVEGDPFAVDVLQLDVNARF